MLKAVSLFTGCGGSDLGLHRAGFDILLANDTNKYASQVYEENLPLTDYVCDDIKNIKFFPSSDLLVGCYPCQGFSQGGVRNPSRKINYLYREFDRALRQIKPKAFIVENVSGMTRANYRHLLNNQITRFRLAGYRVVWEVVNAADHGLPQDRNRLIIVGIRSDMNCRYEFPLPTHGADRATPHVTQKMFIGGMPEPKLGEIDTNDFHWYYLSRNRYRGWEETSKTIVAGMRNMPLHPSSPPLVKHGHNDWRFAHDGNPRRLSIYEAARLQGFPVSFRLPEDVSVAKKYEVIGNAVPPLLMELIVRHLPKTIW